jgi:hypothetical protein
MSDTVAVISVLSSAALGTAGITALTTTKRERDRLFAETKRDRENELRGVADDAAQKMSNAIYQLDRGLTHRKDLEPLHAAFGEIWNCQDRLAIRLGNEAPEVAYYEAAVSHIATAREYLLGAGGNEQTFTENRDAAFTGQRRFREVTSMRLSPTAR